MTPLALHWPRGGHGAQVMAARPCHLEMCILRGATKPDSVSVDPSYHAPRKIYRWFWYINPQCLCPRRFSFQFSSGATPTILYRFLPSALSQSPSLLLAATKQSIKIQFKWQLLHETSFQAHCIAVIRMPFYFPSRLLIP